MGVGVQAMIEIEDDLRMVTAGNAGPMTLHGTNTFVLGRGRVAVIDPGPDLPAHLEAILGGLDAGEEVEAILITHSHLDHSPLSREMSARTGAPVYAFGRHDAARRPLMEKLGEIGGGEGIDFDFAPDVLLADGTHLSGESWEVEVVHTPGHLSNHVCFASGGRMFCGDHVMGWSSTLISPPDGDVRDFMASLDTCIARDESVYYPAHGKPVHKPKQLMASLKAHRQTREAQVLAELEKGPRDIATMTLELYRDVDRVLHGAAARNMLAHVIDLTERGVIAPQGAFSADAVFGLV
jgi:glyoxylase-like metal-dependent hydrolase (beta-lactamase superfamily II)